MVYHYRPKVALATANLSEAYNKYYKKCRLVEQPQLVFGKRTTDLKYETKELKLIGWVSEHYAKEGNLVRAGLDWDVTYLIVKVFPTITTKKYIDKLQEPILC